MQLFRRYTWIAVIGLVVLITLPQLASAQGRRGRGGRGFRSAARIQLATLENVQADLKLTDEQKQLAGQISAKLSEEMQGLRGGGGGGDFAAMREKMDKLNATASAELVGKLDDTQKSRLTEIFVQANGANALADEEVATALALTDDQKKSIASAIDANRQAMMSAFQDFQNMSDEERTEASAKLRKEGDERLLASINAEQQEQFGKMKGKELELDLTQLFPRRGGGGGGRPSN